jgi:hypothetical protein
LFLVVGVEDSKSKPKGGFVALKATRFQVVSAYKSPYPDPIVFQKGEKVTVGQGFKGDPEWAHWVWCTGTNGKQAWVPTQYLHIDGRNGTFKKDYNALELSVTVGERVVVYEVVNGFGMTEKTDGTRGWVPMKHMTPEPK